MSRLLRPTVRRFLMALAAVVPMLVQVPIAAAQSAPAGAAVTITDNDFQPRVVNIRVSGYVTWTNAGSTTHTATTIAGMNPAFNSGGLGPSQTFSWSFVTPGTFYYTSATECLNGINNPFFPCSQTF